MSKVLLALPLLTILAAPAFAEPQKAVDEVQTGRSVATSKPPQPTYWLNEDLNRLSSLLPKDAPVFTDKAPGK